MKYYVLLGRLIYLHFLASDTILMLFAFAPLI